jgi:hypothetical protein
MEFSVDARLLLALLEYKAGWLSNPNPNETARNYPLEGQPPPAGFDRTGLYKQLAWAANQLNRGYYSWKHRGLSILEFKDGERLSFAPTLNAGTVGMQYFLSLNNNYPTWQQQISQDGFYQVYTKYFGDPFANAIDPLIPSDIIQPALTLPFKQGETWFFTGGPHGGWGSGSAWGAIDFAPPDDRPEGSSACYVSSHWAIAVARGLIARSANGSVILDLDADGDETTSWSILYLHMANEGRVAVGTFVEAGDPIGRPSCEGGFSNATHMHIARRYNGEWLPAYCDSCTPQFPVPPFIVNGWRVAGLPNQEYQGYLISENGEQRNAEQGRTSPDNRVTR